MKKDSINYLGLKLDIINLLSHTLENHCIRTAQPSYGGCSRRVHKTVYLTDDKGNSLVNILLLKIVIK